VIFYSPNFNTYDTGANEVFRLNWFFILGILSGFIMLIMSFEAISSEKRSGTLRLQSIYGFKRQTVFWHKYLSYMLLYLVIIFPPALVSLLMFFALTGTWSVVYMLKFLLVLLISVPFASFFVLLGTFISMLKNYRNGIVIIVFIWLLFVVIVPQSANILAKQISPIKTNIEYHELTSKAWDDEWDRWVEEYGSEVTGNKDISTGIRAKAVYTTDEKRSVAKLIEIEDSKRQSRTKQAIASLSPFTQFEKISEVIFDKGFYLLSFAEETTKRSINQIRNLMSEQDSHDEASAHLFYSWASSDGGLPAGLKPYSQKLFDNPDILFVPDIPTEDGFTKTVKVLLRLLPILIMNIVMVGLSVMKLERLDIR
jgi:ABC-type transport system involved in multi-copper enzyme maturation permease subunit